MSPAQKGQEIFLCVRKLALLFPAQNVYALRKCVLLLKMYARVKAEYIFIYVEFL